MRTPLTVMRGKLEVALRRDRDAAYYRQTLEECLEEVAALEQLQEAVLLLGRTRRSDLVQEDIDLRAIAEAEVARVAEGHPERDVSLAMNGAVVVQGDPSLLARAIGNLIDNAANHSVDGGAIRVSVAAQGGHARVVVDDDGPGVPPERHEAIFERFFRGPDVGRRGIAGSGLGLPIVRRIAELHGGTAAIEPAQGGRFVIRLPLT
jgi:signal transduction histidine kinase